MSDKPKIEDLLARIAAGASARKALEGEGDAADPEIRAAAVDLPRHDDAAENLAAWAAAGLATEAELAELSTEDQALLASLEDVPAWLAPGDPDAPPPPSPADARPPTNWSGIVAAMAGLAACLALGIYLGRMDRPTPVSEQVDPPAAAPVATAVPEKPAEAPAEKPAADEPEKPAGDEPERPVAAEPEKPAAKPSAATRARSRPKPTRKPSGSAEDSPPPAPKPAAAPKPAPAPAPKPKRAKSEVDDLLGALDGNSGGGGRNTRAKPAAAPPPTGSDPALPTSLNRRQLLTVVKRGAGGIRSCKDKEPGGPGTISVGMSIAGSGRVTRAKAKGKFAGTPLGECVEAKVKALRFPQFSGPPMNVTMPFSI